MIRRHLNGTTRIVWVICSLVAIKFARPNKSGARCNLYEAILYLCKAAPQQRKMLCPVIACSPKGWVLVARAATPIEDTDQFYHDREAGKLPEWDYDPQNKDCFFEHDPTEPDLKPSDWGKFRGSYVAVDYSQRAIPVCPDDPKEWQPPKRRWWEWWFGWQRRI